MRPVIAACALVAIAPAGVAHGETCKQVSPEFGFIEKLRVDVGGGFHDGTPAGGVAVEWIYHPQVDLGLAIDYTHGWASSDDDSTVVFLATIRLYPLKTFGGIGSDGSCGFKGRLLDHLRGAPYVVLGAGLGTTVDGADVGLGVKAGAGWDLVLGPRLSLFVEAGFAGVDRSGVFGTGGVRF